MNREEEGGGKEEERGKGGGEKRKKKKKRRNGTSRGEREGRGSDRKGAVSGDEKALINSRM